MTYHKVPQSQSGFALVLTVIVVAVVLAIGLSILELSIKEIRLSTLAEGTEISFHAANAGLECARYWRLEASTNFETGATVATECFGVTANDDPTALPTEGSIGAAYQYEFAYTWGLKNNRCSDLNMIVVVSPLDQSATITQATLDPLGYPYDSDFVCRAGGRCTLAFVQGFSNSCATNEAIGTIQREILLRF